MKKSEAIQIIKNELDTSDLTWVAQHILYELVKAGMKPPAKQNQYCPDCDNGAFIFEWEDE